MSENPEDPPAADLPATYWLRPRSNRFLVAAIAGVAIALIACLILGPKPWDEGLDFSRAAKERLRTHSFAVKGLWYAALINLVLIAGALTAWHFRPGEMCDLRRDGASRKKRPSSLRGRSIFISLIAAAIVLSGVLMWPRLSLSLWGDEEATVRRYVIGNVKRLDDDSLVLIAPRWKRSLWNWDNGPNNHMLFNVLARLSHGPGDVSPDDPDRFYFDERKIRLPSFIATLFMIAAAVWLMVLLGFPRGAPLVAFFLALHPWVIRYGTEARGYALMMAFAPLAMCFLLKALRSERSLFWWIAFGLCEFLLLYSHLTAFCFLIPLNLAALWLAWSPSEPGHRSFFRVADVWRLAGANLLGAALTIQLMLPNLLQLSQWLETNLHRGKPTEFSWVENWLSFWSSGMPWHAWKRGNPHSLTLQEAFSSQPAAAWFTVVILGMLLLAGLAALLRQRRNRIWPLPLILPVPLMVLAAFRSGTRLYDWYSVGFLPLAAIVLGIGFAVLSDSFRRFGKGAVILATILLAGAVAVPFNLISLPQRQLNRSQSVEPLAESVRETREVVNPFHPEIDRSLTLGFVHATQLYDPAMIYAGSDEEFVAALQRAEDSGRTLWVNAANLNLGRPVFPNAFALLDNREVFEEPEVLHGLQKACTRYLFRYKPGGLAKAESPR